MSTHRFYDLQAVIDEVHVLFDAWSEAGTFRPPLDTDGEIVLRLAVHEWIANLVQHAAFSEGVLEVRLRIEVHDEFVAVSIEDTSKGFDLLGQLEEQHSLLHAPAPSERGRGLLMLITCTEDLDYRPAGTGRQKLSFHLRNPEGAVFDGLFEPEAAVPYAPDALPTHHHHAAGGDGLTTLPSPPRPDSR